MSSDSSVYSILHAAGRRPELARVAEFVQHVRSGLATRFLLCFFGPSAIGKTELLEQIWEDYEEVLPISFVRAKAFQHADGAFALSDMLVHIIHELDSRLPRRICRLPAGYERLTDQMRLANLMLDLLSRARESEKVALLLLDDYDVIAEEDRRWFEDRILSQLVQTRKVAVILTSEFEPRFTDRIDLRMRLESYELAGLSAEVISVCFPEYVDIAPDIHRATGGLPRLVVEFVQKLQASRVTTALGVRSLEQRLVSEFYDTHLSSTVLSGLKPVMRETLLALSVVRRFDVRLLNGLLPQVMPDVYRSYGTTDYLSLIEVLGSRVQWRMQGGYALNPALRLVLVGYVRVEKPRLYLQVNQEVVTLYRPLLRKDYREHYLVELLYHELAVLLLEKGFDLPAMQTSVSEELLRCIGAAASMRDTDLISLRNSLVHDPDLKGYVSKQALATIQDLINSRLKESRLLSSGAKRLRMGQDGLLSESFA